MTNSMEEELDEFGIPINPVDTKSKAAKPKAVKEEVDEFGIPLKKKRVLLKVQSSLRSLLRRVAGLTRRP